MTLLISQENFQKKIILHRTKGGFFFLASPLIVILKEKVGIITSLHHSHLALVCFSIHRASSSSLFSEFLLTSSVFTWGFDKTGRLSSHLLTLTYFFSDPY